MTFGEKLLNLRRARGWTQEELADKIGVTRQALSKWEASSALPDTKNVVALAKLFGVTTDYLLCGDDGAEPGAPAQGNVKGGDGKNKAIALGLILLALGLAGLFTLGIAGSFFDTIFVVDGREYRYMAAMLRANKFIILLLIIAVASALAGPSCCSGRRSGKSSMSPRQYRRKSAPCVKRKLKRSAASCTTP